MSFFANPASIITLVTAATGLLTVLISLITIFTGRKRKELTYKILSHASLVHPDAQSAVNISLLDGTEVPDAGFLVFSVKNTGNIPITGADYIMPITFLFKEREVIGVTDVRTEPEQGLVNRGNITTSANDQKPGSLTLEKPALNKNTTIILSILLMSGSNNTEPQISHSGGLTGGSVKRYRTQKGIPGRIVTIGAGAALLVISVILLVTRVFPPPPSPPPNPNCASGTIALGGSTALLPLAKEAAQRYMAMCLQANISTNQNVASSEAGLREVEAGHIDIGDSDLASSNLGLVDHPVAVAPFVVVLGQGVYGVTNLTLAQIQGIYNGSIAYWDQDGIGGPHQPVFVVSRTSTSGTRKTFEKYILGHPEMLPISATHPEVDTTDLVASTIASTQYAIGYIDVGTATKQKLQTVSIDGVEALAGEVENGRYPFWTVEHMYTKGNPTGLTKSFLDYLLGDSAKGMITDVDYVPFNSMPLNTVNAHPSPNEPGL